MYLYNQYLFNHLSNISNIGVLTSKLSKDAKVAINPGNVVLRGCVVRSTEWIVGVVVNTGHDVKIMQSNTKARIKASNLDELATTEIFYVVFMLVLLCFTGATGQSIFISKHSLQDHWYLGITVYE